MNTKSWLVLIILAVGLTGCGTPALVTAGNLGSSPTVAPKPTTVEDYGPTPGAAVTAVAVAATQAPVVAPTQVSTQSPAQAPTQSPAQKSEDYVVLWVLFGTPTATGASGVQPAPVSPVTVAPATIAPTRPPATSAAATLPPTTAPTRVAAVQPTMAGHSMPATATRPPVTAAPTTNAGSPAPSGGANTLKGNPARGKVLFAGSAACGSCHDVAAGITVVGPTMKGIFTKSATRKAGQSAIDYLRESIVKPNAYVVPGFTAGIMLQNYGQSLTETQIDDLVAYLATLR